MHSLWLHAEKAYLMTKLAVEKKETYDYAVRLVGSKHIICMSFDRDRMEKNAERWNAYGDGHRYEVVQRLRVLMVTDWYDPLDKTV